jgi:hypothetical protein
MKVPSSLAPKLARLNNVVWPITLFVNGERAIVMSESNGRTRGSPNDEIHEGLVLVFSLCSCSWVLRSSHLAGKAVSGQMQLNPSRASAIAERSLLDPFDPTRAPNSAISG